MKNHYTIFVMIVICGISFFYPRNMLAQIENNDTLGHGLRFSLIGGVSIGYTLSLSEDARFKIACDISGDQHLSHYSVIWNNNTGDRQDTETNTTNGEVRVSALYDYEIFGNNYVEIFFAMGPLAAYKREYKQSKTYNIPSDSQSPLANTEDIATRRIGAIFAVSVETKILKNLAVFIEYQLSGVFSWETNSSSYNTNVDRAEYYYEGVSRSHSWSIELSSLRVGTAVYF